MSLMIKTPTALFSCNALGITEFAGQSKLYGVNDKNGIAVTLVLGSEEHCKRVLRDIYDQLYKVWLETHTIEGLFVNLDEVGGVW